MAGEQILIVDDTPVNLKLTRILLVNEGYKVLTAGSAEEALELLRSYHPQLVLADIQLPGMDGLELTRHIKRAEATQDITVIALTAFAMAGDERKAVDAGCDGYITKPIDTRTLGTRIREILDRRTELRPVTVGGGEAAAATQGGEKASVSPTEMLALRRRFLAEGLDLSRQLLLDLDAQFNPTEAAKQLHNWVGTGGLLGYTAISRLAREVEAILHEPPLDNSQLRESMTNLVLAFSSPREARDEAVPEAIVQSLAGKKVAVVGFPPNESERMVVALERAQAIAAFFGANESPDSPTVKECALAAVHVRPETVNSPWLNPATPGIGARPIVFVGAREHLLSLDESVQGLAREFLMDSWLPEEVLVRLSLALSTRPAVAQSAGAMLNNAAPEIKGKVQIVIADDDSTVLLLVRTALQNFGMECQSAANGPEALEMIRQVRPHAAVLDVNMPGMDGYAVLAAIRKEGIPARVMLLTARQQESDVIRGFSLGADDYVVKPFSPMELVARLKRLLGR
ncbi:MAG TPA: response regulator [Verrucomicrobiae bacterium]|nr:response regulator [Verrucomicrobiae bacterium]